MICVTWTFASYQVIFRVDSSCSCFCVVASVSLACRLACLLARSLRFSSFFFLGLLVFFARFFACLLYSFCRPGSRGCSLSNGTAESTVHRATQAPPAVPILELLALQKRKTGHEVPVSYAPFATYLELSVRRWQHLSLSQCVACSTLFGRPAMTLGYLDLLRQRGGG